MWLSITLQQNIARPYFAFWIIYHGYVCDRVMEVVVIVVVMTMVLWRRWRWCRWWLYAGGGVGNGVHKDEVGRRANTGMEFAESLVGNRSPGPEVSGEAPRRKCASAPRVLTTPFWHGESPPTIPCRSLPTRRTVVHTPTAPETNPSPFWYPPPDEVFTSYRDEPTVLYWLLLVAHTQVPTNDDTVRYIIILCKTIPRT